MCELVECAPNFSTSDSVTVGKILEAITSVKGVLLLDHSYDDYYNRLVVTVAGEGRDLAQAVLPGAVKAVELIDMKKHRGQHPRFGAVDVAPFVPIADSTIDSLRNLREALQGSSQLLVTCQFTCTPNPRHLLSGKISIG